MQTPWKMAALGALAFIASSAGAQELSVRIGHVAATSGNWTYMGRDNEMGARMAIDELNAQGLLIGGKKARFELLAEDDAGDPRQATAVAQKLVDSGVNGVVGHLNSGTSIPAARIYSDAGIAQISPSATDPKYTQLGYKTTFRLLANDLQMGSVLARYAVNTLQARTIAIVDDRTAYGQGLAQEFDSDAVVAGAKVVTRQYTSDKASDFTAILTAIKATKPDILFFAGGSAQAGPMLRQMVQLGIKAKFMGGDGVCTNDLPGLSGGAVAQIQVFCTLGGGVEGAQKKRNDDFRAAYKKKMGAEVMAYAPNAYDAVKLIAAAMAKAGSAEPAKYLPVLAATDSYPGVSGDISFDSKGDLKNGALTLFVFKGAVREALAIMH
jgi:branched-chain amino acid transport system substrate-binding protein